jgi:hypothetical protein
MTKPRLAFWGAIFVFSIVSLNNEYKLLSSMFTISSGKVIRLRIPPDLDPEITRRLSLNLGGGACEWQVRSLLKCSMYGNCA